MTLLVHTLSTLLFAVGIGILWRLGKRGGGKS